MSECSRSNLVQKHRQTKVFICLNHFNAFNTSIFIAVESMSFLHFWRFFVLLLSSYPFIDIYSIVSVSHFFLTWQLVW